MGAIGLLWWFVANEGLLLWLTCFGLCCLRGWLYAIKTRGQIKSRSRKLALPFYHFLYLACFLDAFYKRNQVIELN